jgi:hypothetical protein
VDYQPVATSPSATAQIQDCPSAVTESYPASFLPLSDKEDET